MAAVDWPLPDRFRPILDSVREQMPNLIRRTAFEDGEDRARRTAHRRPHVFSGDFECSPAERQVMRRWVDEDLDGGAGWFNFEVWIDGTYQWVEARLVATGDDALFEAVPETQDVFVLSLTYEVRELPRMDDDPYLIALLGGDAAAADLAAALVEAMEVTLPQAAGPP